MHQKTKDTIDDIEEDMKLIRIAAPSYDSWTRLTQAEIPGLEADLRKLNQSKELLVEQYNKVGAQSAPHLVVRG